jgi:hypothetical protein
MIKNIILVVILISFPIYIFGQIEKKEFESRLADLKAQISEEGTELVNEIHNFINDCNSIHLQLTSATTNFDKNSVNAELNNILQKLKHLQEYLPQKRKFNLSKDAAEKICEDIKKNQDKYKNPIGEFRSKSAEDLFNEDEVMRKSAINLKNEIGSIDKSIADIYSELKGYHPKINKDIMEINGLLEINNRGNYTSTNDLNKTAIVHYNTLATNLKIHLTNIINSLNKIESISF